MTTTRHMRTLDGGVDGLSLTDTEINALQVVCHELSVNPRLRITLADGSIPPERRSELARDLVGQRLGDRVGQVLGMVAAMATDAQDLEFQMGRQADRAVLRSAQDLGKVREELSGIIASLLADPELASTLTDPSLDLAARQQLAANLLEGRACPATAILVKRAVTGRRLVERLVELTELTSEVVGHQLARVTAAAPLTAEQRARLMTELDRIFAVKVDLHVDVDPRVLGGLHVRVGGEIIDGTIRTRLDKARRLIG
ncbi:ATP synthase F1, delta subunit [Propionibacterium sp. oral taxon 192 str. F0372]|uniref:ATP synthase F1 subunit delta n=1 Tax=Propionibacterium sp. oral taxon 192 TaxID=671222 RepID=UPI000354952E|nr:ATP synthase F1 subunit delta [Propionibacterium sp. oral taxon 192]EPH02684.1 ATP synthase F1, delta subunit [Propionibacterium sp. oral taxon 192 str. F0372]